MLNNNVLDELFNEIKREDETYYYYFYTMKIAATSEYIKFGPSAVLEKHLIICFTNKRIIMLEITPLTGKLNGNHKVINIEDVENIKVKRGLLKTKIVVTLKGNNGNLIMNPNSFTFGLSNHKKNLIKLEEQYS